MAAPAITINQMAVSLRLAASINETLDPSIMDILTREMDTGINEITVYAPDAPEANASEALVRMVGFFFDRPTSENPFTNSGARAMLSHWHMPQGTQI